MSIEAIKKPKSEIEKENGYIQVTDSRTLRIGKHYDVIQYSDDSKSFTITKAIFKGMDDTNIYLFDANYTKVDRFDLDVKTITNSLVSGQELKYNITILKSQFNTEPFNDLNTLNDLNTHHDLNTLNDLNTPHETLHDKVSFFEHHTTFLGFADDLVTKYVMGGKKKSSYKKGRRKTKTVKRCRKNKTTKRCRKTKPNLCRK